MNMNLGDTRAIVAECRKYGLLRNQCAYVLATAFWETARTMEPVRETLAPTDEAAIARLDRAWSRGQLPWVSAPYWREGWFGRGYVQLTHEANYARAGRLLGIDLVGNPSLALEPDIAATILVRGMAEGWFTGKRLSDYITLQRSDFVGARRVVNGTDRAQAIAELARDYDDALRAEGYGVNEPVAPIANERRDGTPARTSPAQSRTLLAQVLQWAGATFPAAAAWFSAEDAMVKVAVIAFAGIAVIAGAVIFRERLRKWAEGDR